MLQHLKEKKDVGFFTSVAGLMQQCWYERCCFYIHTYTRQFLGRLKLQSLCADEGKQKRLKVYV